MKRKYCIIGTGVAAVNAAKAIRDQDQDGEILVFGAEKSLPYNRIKLSKALFSDLSSEKVLIKKEKWYGKNNIQLFSNTKVEKIDIDQHAIHLSTGELIHYDKLLICTGAKNRKLPIKGVDKKGVFTIREMQDADNFKAFIEDKTRIVNIGGGVQGLETAWSLHLNGKQVSIVEAGPRLMGRQLDEKTSTLLKNKLEEAGVEIYLDTSINEIFGENEVEEIIIGDRRIPCESVIYSIGVVPNIELVENTPILTNRGIVVNERMETNVKDIYAAGDVTELNGEIGGLWGRAMDQGKVAGQNMALASGSYQKTTPITVFNAFNLSLFSIGLVDERVCDRSIIEEDDEGNYTRVFIKDQKMVGVISLEGVVASTKYVAAIENGVLLAHLDLNNLTVKDLMSEVNARLAVPA